MGVQLELERIRGNRVAGSPQRLVVVPFANLLGNVAVL